MANEDALASILRVKYMLEGQDVEICHQMIRHWNSMYRPYWCTADARKIPGVAVGSSLAAPAAGTVPSGSSGREGQSGIRSLAPTFELANHRLWRPPPSPSPKSHKSK